MRKGVSKRIKITKNGKIKRRKPGLCHARVNKTGKQIIKKREMRGINYPTRVIRKNILSMAA